MDAGLREQAAILLLELDAMAALIDDTPAVAWSRMDQAIALQNQMPKPIGRPYPVKSADELYGELLLEAGRAKDAVGWFEKALDARRTAVAPCSAWRAAGGEGRADREEPARLGTVPRELGERRSGPARTRRSPRCPRTLTRAAAASSRFRAPSPEPR